MSFTTTLSKYDLIEKHAAAANGVNTGRAGDQQLFDVINSVNGDVIVASSLTPRASALAALTAVVSSTSIVTYRNSSGSVSGEMSLATAS
jgi:hypothetical protein